MKGKLLIKSVLLLAVLLAGVNTKGQTIIARQDFEATPATPVWTYSNSNGAVSTATGATDTPANQRIRGGARSFQVNNATSTVTFADVNVTNYTGVKVVVRISSTSTNVSNGADGTDFLRAFVKLNAAAFATNSQATADIAVNGNSNARWGYNTTGVTTNAGTNTVVAGTGGTSGGTNQGTIYSTLTINIPDGTTAVGLRLNILNNAIEEVWNVDDVEITGTAGTPVPAVTVTPTSLTGFTYVAGSGPSAQQSFTVSGANLTGDITVPATASYEISTTSGSGFGSTPITLAQSGGTVGATTIYVRLRSGLTAASYNESITTTSPGAANKVVSLTGTVTAPVISAALAGTLTEPTLTAGTATATVTLTNDTYAATLTTAGFTLNNAPAGLTLSSVVRTSNNVATLHFTYTGDIESNVTNLNVTVATSQLATSTSALTTGNITISAVAETLTPSPTSLTGFTYAFGSGPSTAQSFTLSSGNNLQAGGGTITITAPSNFEVSTTSATAGFGASATLSYTGTGTISPNQAWVRLKAGLAINSYSQTVTIAGGKASTSVTVSGSVVNPPPANDNCSGATALTLNAAAVTGTFQYATQSLPAATCNTATGNADDDVWYSFTTDAAGNYTITADGGTDLDVIIDLRSGACDGSNLACIDLTGEGQEMLTANLSAATTYYIRIYEFGALSGLSSYNFTLKVVKDLDAPVATAATNVSTTGFTANWNTVTDATGYRLDVSTLSNFGSSQIAEGFESATFPPAGWTTTGWTRSLSGGDVAAGSAAAIGGSQSGSITTTAVAHPTTMVFNLGRSSSNTNPKTLYVEVSTTSQSSGFAIVATYDHNNVLAGSYSQYSVDLSAYSSSPTVYIRFRKESSTTSPWRLDEVAITSQIPMVTGYSNRTVNGTSEVVTGLTPNTTYYYRVRAVKGAVTSPNSNAIQVKTGLINTWNGTAWSAGTVPTLIDNAIINGDYNTLTNGAFAAAQLTVQTDTLIVASGTFITVEKAITVNNGAAMLVHSNGSVIQVDETADNTGDVTVYRETSPLKRLDYKMWSSPVAAQNMLAFSPLTDVTRFYRYNTQTNQFNSVTPSSTAFGQGRGYLIRVPNNHPTTATIWQGAYKGDLYNGQMSIPVEVNTLNAPQSYNAIGNPYASPIDADAFLNVNEDNIDGTLYFWRKTNGAATETYVTYNGLGQTQIPGVPAPNGIIAVGQGFIVNAAPGAANVVFNNAMRVASFGNQVFRMNAPAQAAGTTPEKHRIWLNITNNEGAFSQALVGYATGATNGVEKGMDSKYLNNNAAALFSVIGAEKYTIQGRALPFTATDVIPMGYKATTAGTFTIAIDHVDGLFTAGQVVYIKDNVTATTHNLTEGSYSFTTGEGTFTNRFEIVFMDGALGTDVPALTADNLIVYKEGNAIKVNTGTVEMAGVAIYDMRGRLIASQTGVNATEATINNVAIQQQVLIVQVTTAQHGTISKKFVY